MRPASPARPFRGLLPIAAVLLLAGGTALWLTRGSEIHTVSSVEARIRAIALANLDPDAPAGANFLGPWALAARAVDPETGALLDLRVEIGDTRLVAERATILVDPTVNTFSLDLERITLFRLPPLDSTEPADVRHLEFWTLGPTPFGADIRPDPGAVAPTPAPRAPRDERPDRIATVDDYAVTR